MLLVRGCIALALSVKTKAKRPPDNLSRNKNVYIIQLGPHPHVREQKLNLQPKAKVHTIHTMLSLKPLALQRLANQWRTVNCVMRELPDWRAMTQLKKNSIVVASLPKIKKCPIFLLEEVASNATRVLVLLDVIREREIANVTQRFRDFSPGFLTAKTDIVVATSTIVRGLSQNSANNPLSDREMQVLWGMADGNSNGQIGKELVLTEDTIKTHARRIFRKMRTGSREGAVAIGFRWGILR